MAHVMTVKEVAIYLKLGRGTVVKYAKAGRLPAMQCGRTWRFSKEEIDKWLSGEK